MQTVTLSQICSRLNSGSSIAASMIKEAGKYPVYGGNGLRGYTDTYNFDGECALIGRQGEQCGNVRYFVGKGYMTEHAIVLCTKENVDTKYIACLLSLLNLRRLSGQSAQPGLSVNTLGNLKIDCLPYSQQVLIGNTIKKIDRKIANNEAVNNNLEQMAFDVYMHRFFKKQCNGKLDEIIEENSKSAVQVGDAKSVSGEFPFFTSGDAILEWHQSMVEGRNCYLNTGGNADVKYYVGRAAYSTDTWCITAKNNLADYLYLFLKSIRLELNKKFFQGTGLKHLQKPLLKARPIYIPTEAEAADFNSCVQPLFDMISANVRENKTLNRLRDWLLPMLMSGQATIAE